MAHFSGVFRPPVKIIDKTHIRKITFNIKRLRSSYLSPETMDKLGRFCIRLEYVTQYTIASPSKF